MLYQEALPKIWFVPQVVIACLLIVDRHWQKLATKLNQPIYFLWWFLMWGAYFCVGSYKWDVVVVVKMGAKFVGILWVRLYST